MARVPEFLLTVVKKILLLPGIRDDLSFALGVFSRPSLSYIAEENLPDEVHNFTDLLKEVGRISFSEQSHMERGFLDFIAIYRRVSRPGGYC